MGMELREYPRLEQEFKVFFDIVPGNIPEPVIKPKREATAKNVSGGGLYLVVSDIRPGIIKKLQDKSNILSLEFYLPDFQNKIKALGEVRWVRDGIHWWKVFPKTWSIGVKFIYIRTEDKDSIIKYVINKKIEEHLAKPR